MIEEIQKNQESELNNVDSIERESEIKRHLINIADIGFNRLNNNDFAGYVINPSFNGKAIKKSDLDRINEKYNQKLKMIQSEKDNILTPEKVKKENSSEKEQKINEVVKEPVETPKEKEGILNKEKKAEIEKYIKDRIIFTGTDWGFTTIDNSNIKNEGAGLDGDVRRYSDNYYEIITDNDEHLKSLFKDLKYGGDIYSWHIIDNYVNKGKKYLIVGISNRGEGKGLDPERDGSVFASIEDTGNLPSNIKIFLEKALIDKYEEVRIKRPNTYGQLPKEFLDKFNTRYSLALAELDKKFGKNTQTEETLITESTEENSEEKQKEDIYNTKTTETETVLPTETVATVKQKEDVVEKEKQEKISEEDSTTKEAPEKNIENPLWTKEMERELQAIITEDREADIKLAELLEMINQLPNDKEAKENPDININKEDENNPPQQKESGEKNKEIKMEDFTWSFPDYVNRTGELYIKGDIVNKIKIVENKHTEVKRNLLGRLTHMDNYKKTPLENPYWEIISYNKDGEQIKIEKVDILEGEVLKKVDEIYNAEKEKQRTEIEKDRNEKPLLYYAFEKIQNKKIKEFFQNKMSGADLRKIALGEESRRTNLLIHINEKEGFFDFNLYGFAKVIKNIEAIRDANGKIDLSSNKAIYKIIGPNEEVVVDNIQGYNEATRICWEKTNEYKKVVEEEFNKLNNNQK